jgi:hypothetical protein
MQSRAGNLPKNGTRKGREHETASSHLSEADEVMAIQLGALRDALLEAGASVPKANQASEEVAAYEGRLASIEFRLSLLVWMVGGLYAGLAGIGWLVLRTAAKAGAI